MQVLFSHALGYFKFLAISPVPQHIYMLCAMTLGYYFLSFGCTSSYTSVREYFTALHLFRPISLYGFYSPSGESGVTPSQH